MPVRTIILILVLVVSACDTMRHVKCDDTVLVKIESPGNKFAAVSYRRSCANNTGRYTVVSLQELHQVSRDRSEPETILTLSGYHDVTTKWIDPNNLQITSPAVDNPSVVLTRVEVWRDVTISFNPDH